jgi:hypothetical protein
LHFEVDDLSVPESEPHIEYAHFVFGIVAFEVRVGDRYRTWSNFEPERGREEVGEDVLIAFVPEATMRSEESLVDFRDLRDIKGRLAGEVKPRQNQDSDNDIGA